MKKSILTQQKNIEELLKLAVENPDLEIVPMVDSDCVFSDDFSSWMASWGSAKIDEYYSSDERIYFKSEDYDTLVDKEYDAFYDTNLDDVTAMKLAKEKVAAYDWTKVIVVRINPL
jgi:nicotinamidase-related amidase